MIKFLVRFASNKIVVLFAIVFIFICLGSLIVPMFNVSGDGAQHLKNALLPPMWLEGSAGHFLGTDGLGRDVFAMIMLGGRYSLGMTIIIAGLSIFLGTLVGFVAVFEEDKVLGKIINFITDIGVAFPTFFLCLVASKLAGHNSITLIILLAVLLMMGYIKIIKNEIKTHYVKDFVMVAKLLGARRYQVMLDILPNCWHTIINGYAVNFTITILSISTLGFLGLGIQNIPEWGMMLNNSQELVNRAWWVPTFIGGAIFISVVSMTFICYGIRASLDIKVKYVWTS